MTFRIATGLLLIALHGHAQPEDPKLRLGQEGIGGTGPDLGASPGFSRMIANHRRATDDYFRLPPEVPVPADAGGGYTHERHKKNGIAIHNAGLLYRFTGDRRYAVHARDLLVRYAGLYPTLGEHPRRKEQSPGRLFWQSLNEAVWLVYAIQGYDAVATSLTDDERALITSRLLRPMADFLSLGQPKTFDRIHNHGTWAAAAVGMTGYALGDRRLVTRALYGTRGDGTSGFLKQLDLLFSPDGYYTEGPYYQRYALMPFVLLARSIESNQPELKIFDYRDQILLKAIYTCIDLSYGGLFFPINDAIKDKGLDTIELRHGVAAAYALTGDNALLSIAQRQSGYVMTDDGFLVARSIDKGMARPYDFASRLHTDGPEGSRGALAVLRNTGGGQNQALLLKATSQGMGHGHFDRLNWLFYDNGNEIVVDYGAARFLNVPQKNGGRYLPENETWAKQSVAHNTLVADERSHFGGNWKLGERHHARVIYFGGDERARVASAEMAGAWEGILFSRTIALLNLFAGAPAVVVDVLYVDSNEPHQYDLPVHFSGQYVASSRRLEFDARSLQPMGNDNGYQHLWQIGSAEHLPAAPFSMTWLKKGRFYTYHTVAGNQTDVYMMLSGAGDPARNLRNEQSLLLRVSAADRHTFTSVLEPHGEYNGAEEFTTGSMPLISGIKRLSDGDSDLIRISVRSGGVWHLGLARGAGDDEAEHAVTAEGHSYEWRGFYALFEDRNLVVSGAAGGLPVGGMQ